METDTKVSGKIALSMAKDRTFFIWVMCTLVSINMENLMDSDSTNGKIKALILVNFKMVLNMVKANGVSEEQISNATLTTVNIYMIRNLAWEFSPGKVATNIKDTTKMMSVMVTVKCSGPMEVVTKVNGKMVYNMDLVKWNFLMDV